MTGGERAPADRRRFTRHEVSGKARFTTVSGQEGSGELADIAAGSLRMRSTFFPHIGEDVLFQLAIDNCPTVFVLNARVVRVDADTMAVAFLEEPPGLREFIKSLEVMHPAGEILRTSDFCRCALDCGNHTPGKRCGAPATHVFHFSYVLPTGKYSPERETGFCDSCWSHIKERL